MLSFQTPKANEKSQLNSSSTGDTQLQLLSTACYANWKLIAFLVVLGLIMIPIRMQVRWVIELLLSLKIKQGSFLLAALAGITHCRIVFPSNTWIRGERGEVVFGEHRNSLL